MPDGRVSASGLATDCRCYYALRNVPLVQGESDVDPARVRYDLGMNSDVVVRIPRPLAEQLDRQAKDQLRSRSNLAVWLIRQGLQDETKKGDR